MTRTDSRRNAAELFQELNALDESLRIEAKTCTKVDKSVMETVCAFANEPYLGGGHLLLGVRRQEDALLGIQYEVVGVEDPDQIQSDLASQCASVFNSVIRPGIHVYELCGKRVVVVWVPEAAAAEKPVFLTRLGLPKGAYRRIGSTDQSCNEDDLIPLYAGRQVETYDMSLVPDGDWSDFDPQAIEDYRTLRAKANPGAEELNWNDHDLLRALSAVRLVDGQPRPTVAGLLLFGTPMALRRCFPMMRIDYIRVPGREWVSDPDKRFDTLEIRAPLLLAIRRAVNTIADDLLKSFTLVSGEVQSEQQPQLPLRVIREAVVNAVMHRSYRAHGAIQIIRYANRLEIRNPGHSLKAEEALGQPGSETRNPKIAAVLHEVHAAETKGSGIRVMRELMRAHDLMPPTFESTRHPDQFVAYLLLHNLLGEDDLNWVHLLTSEDLSAEDVRALVFVRELGAIDNAAYREINGVDTLAASSHLRRLRDLELLTMNGSGNKTYYTPGDRFRSSTTAAEDAYHPSPNTHQSAVNAHHPLESIPVPLREMLPQPGKKPRKQEVRGVILALCAYRPMGADELSALLGGRDPKFLVRNHLTPMREDGLLAFTIPKMPNHPDQKYKVAEQGSTEETP